MVSYGAMYEVHCDICLKNLKGEAAFGEMLSKGDIDVHYYCLLSAVDIPQNGKDKSGIRGFLLEDIKSALPIIRKRKCCFCFKNCAAVKCAEKGCTQTWDYLCGKTNGCITQFIGKFKSYCAKHAPRTNLAVHCDDAICNICFLKINGNHPSECVVSSCCIDLLKEFPDKSDSEVLSGCFNHLACVQKYTLNAGRDSKCIFCPMEHMSKSDFQDQMRRKGIYIPYADAVWEQDEYYKKMTKWKCGVEGCKNSDKSKVYTCFACGCNPSHLSCAKVKTHEEYLCANCWDQTFVEKLPRSSKSV